MVGGVEPRVLAGEVKMDRRAGPRQRGRDGSELDGLGPGPDDETDTNRSQLSPWLRQRHPAASALRSQALRKYCTSAAPFIIASSSGERKLATKRPSIDGVLVAQITDLHIGFDRDNPHEINVRRLNLVIDQLNAMRPKPSLLLVTGDLVEYGDDLDAYRHMQALVGRW